MKELTSLTNKERTFLESMVSVESKKLPLEQEKVDLYRDKYGCDPCDGCGPDACADCTPCAVEDFSLYKLNFYRFKK